MKKIEKNQEKMEFSITLFMKKHPYLELFPLHQIPCFSIFFSFHLTQTQTDTDITKTVSVVSNFEQTLLKNHRQTVTDIT